MYCSYMLRVRGCVVCLFFFCLYVCVCLYFQIQGPLQECRSIRPGASGLPYYCTPRVCVPDVIALLAVWRHNKPKPKKSEERLTSVAPKEEFGRMIKKNLPWGTVLKLSNRRRQLLVYSEVRRGAGTCEAPCILNYHCSSASLQPA